MDRLIGGPGAFQQMFSIDRPARGPLFEAYFQLFGINPLPYHMASFLWRLLSGLSAWWLFKLMFPRRRDEAFLMGLLFLIYPGYLRWMEGFENQPRILGALLEVVSICLTLFALRSGSRVSKISAWLGAIITGWAYLALVDFAIGMEVFRLACIFILYFDPSSISISIRKWAAAIKNWGIVFLIPAGFMLWRMLIFKNERPATDVGLQLGSLVSSPLSTGLWWFVRLFQSAVETMVLAWTGPNFQVLFGLRLNTIMLGLVVAFSAAAIVVFFEYLQKKVPAQSIFIENDENGWQHQAIWAGILGVVFGVAPVILANRYVAFDHYSHYLLPASLAASLLAAGFVYSIRSPHVRNILIAVMVILACLTHFSVADQVISEEKAYRVFWQQAAWRIPGLSAGTTLMVNYPGINYGEDVDAAAGPANFIYYPSQTNQLPAVYQLVALPQMDYVTKDVINGGDKPYEYRTHTGVINYSKLLIMVQPSDSSCVHVQDAQWPRITDQDTDQVLLLAKYSRIENIEADGKSPILDPVIFGAEPAHTWCYYYEKAELALQKQDWQEIIRLGKEVNQHELHPVDRIEWAPFLQAYAFSGDEMNFKSTALKIDSSPFVRLQACKTITQMKMNGILLSAGIESLLGEKLCRGQ